MKCRNCQSCQGRVGWIGMSVGIIVAAFTIAVGLLNGSKALIAVSLCSGIDVATAMTVLLGVKLSAKPMDQEHPYGYGKVEFLVSCGLSLLLIGSATILLYHSAKSIFHGEPGPGQWLTLVAALIAGLVNALLYRYANCVARHTNSPAIRSHAEHARVDVFSAIAVSVAVLSARVGLHFVDPLIAILEIGHILYVSWKMLQDNVAALMDASAPASKVREIAALIAGVAGVGGLQQLVARDVGQHVWIETTILVAPTTTVAASRSIAADVEKEITTHLQHAGSIQVKCTSRVAG